MVHELRELDKEKKQCVSLIGSYSSSGMVSTSWIKFSLQMKYGST
jgi:hypothetical protein